VTSALPTHQLPTSKNVK